MDMNTLVKNLSVDPAGIFHIGDDGVLRSLSANKTVLGFVQLKPAELTAYSEGFSTDAEMKRHLDKVWHGVDGRDVKDLEELLYPRGGGMTPWTSTGELDKRATCGCDPLCSRNEFQPVEMTGREVTPQISARSRLFPRTPTCLSINEPCFSTEACNLLFLGCVCVFVDCARTGTCRQA